MTCNVITLIFDIPGSVIGVITFFVTGHILTLANHNYHQTISTITIHTNTTMTFYEFYSMKDYRLYKKEKSTGSKKAMT